MNKLGLYVQVGHDPEVRRKLERLQPAVVVCHLDSDLPEWIRGALPGCFVIGRRFWRPEEQEAALGLSGEQLADVVMGSKGAGACGAVMLFNEFLPSPVDNGGLPEFRAKARRLDALQVEFLRAVRRRGVEAVAWNFAAGNWPTSDHYNEHFPLTLAAYHYLGFHVYGWPKLAATDWRSNLAQTLRICDGFPGHACVLTEMAVTRAYGNQGPDVGWMSEPGPISLDEYASDLAAVHGELCRRRNIMGAALFNGAPEATWRTFATPMALVERLAGLRCEGGQEETAAPVEPVAQAVRLVMPVQYPDVVSVVSQWWGENPANYNGWGHEGVDLALPTGTPVAAACGGTVHKTMLSPVYGKYVRVVSSGVLENPVTGERVTGTWETVYAHLSRIEVKAGEVVAAGQRIGQVGSTGRSTGPHLHFGLRLPGQKGTDKFWGYSDPAGWLGLSKVKPPVGEDRRRALVREIRERLEELAGLV